MHIGDHFNKYTRNEFGIMKKFAFVRLLNEVKIENSGDGTLDGNLNFKFLIFFFQRVF